MCVFKICPLASENKIVRFYKLFVVFLVENCNMQRFICFHARNLHQIHRFWRCYQELDIIFFLETGRAVSEKSNRHKLKYFRELRESVS